VTVARGSRPGAPARERRRSGRLDRQRRASGMVAATVGQRSPRRLHGLVHRLLNRLGERSPRVGRGRDRSRSVAAWRRGRRLYGSGGRDCLLAGVVPDDRFRRTGGRVLVVRRPALAPGCGARTSRGDATAGDHASLPSRQGRVVWFSRSGAGLDGREAGDADEHDRGRFRDHAGAEGCAGSSLAVLHSSEASGEPATP